MSEKKEKFNYKRVILEQLRHPLKLRLFLCFAIIIGWYLAFFSPLSESMTATTAKVVAEHKRVATAREIVKLKKSACFPTTRAAFPPRLNSPS